MKKYQLVCMKNEKIINLKNISFKYRNVPTIFLLTLTQLP